MISAPSIHFDLLQKYNLEFSYQQELFDYAHSLGLIVGSTPWDSQSAKFLNQDVISYIKVSSADLTNIPLITEVSKFGKPLILSTGMSTEDDILSTVEHLTSTGSQFVILHCNSTYPCPYEDINLSYVNRLKGIHPLIGYSGHERGLPISFAAAALGCVVIERHVTLDKSLEGPDHHEFTYRRS